MKALLALVAFAASCTPQIEMRDVYQADALETRVQTMRSAPIIFAGVVTEVVQSGEPKPATMMPSLFLQLYRASCRVEFAIRGTLPDALEFWYYGPDPEAGMVGFPKFWLQPRQRRIFFAVKEGPRYRAVGDYLDYTEWVHTGKPGFMAQLHQRDAGQLIARLLLTPGREVDEGEFAGSLLDAKVTAEAFSTPAFTTDLLTDLASHAMPRVRVEACRILLVHYKKRPQQCM